MARRNPKDPPSEFKWKKGQSGNPLGGKLHNPEMRKVKNLSKQELIDIANLILKNNFSELKELAEDKENHSVLKVMVASVAAKIISEGNMGALDVLLNRLIGKVKDEVLHTGDLNVPQVIVTLPSNGREKKKEEIE